MRTFMILNLLGTMITAAAVQAAEPEHPSAPPSQMILKTGKERLSDKATDEQRVDDCKVSPERRTLARPTACPWDVGS
jgi:hypothetical protein